MRLVCSYSAIFHGFAVRLTEAELAAVAKLPGFLRALPDGKRELLTTRTSSFLGLSRDEHRFWSDAGYGRGVVIGVLVSGIYGKHLSFDDDGVPEPPARWNGTCTGSEVTQCNRKLVGSKSFVGDFDPEDDIGGHDTHVADITAGNFVEGASLPGGLGSGTAAGIAPLAHLAVYKVCSDEDDDSRCDNSSISCGMEEAVQDGEDVINLSLGSRTNTTFNMDPIAIGAFNALAKGILVVSAAGNGGPAPSTLCNDASWMLTVGAGSVDRRFDAEVEFEPTIVVGEALFQDPHSEGLYPLVYTEEKDDDRGNYREMVICKVVLDTEVQASIIRRLESLGAAGVLLIDDEAEGYTTALRDYSDYSYGSYNMIQINSFEGRGLTDYAKTLHPSARVSFNGVVLGVQHSPTVASFSARGPSQLSRGLLKPDILAPGLNILAASASNGGSTDSWSSRFKVMSGTSMAAPHIIGVVALLKSAHPDWSPAAIKSAILTTADALDNGGWPILDEQHDGATSFAMGTGHVNASRATDPGLVYDLGARDYASYISGLLGEKALKNIMRDPSSTCSEVGSIPEAWLNYPTIMVTLKDKDMPVTVPRTVTNVGPAETCTATVEGASWMDIRVSPDTLMFSKPGEKTTFNVTVTVNSEVHKGTGDGDFAEDSLIWVSTKHLVRSSIVAVIDHGL
ncbi:hypothetical protein C2845_PM05G28750 [Panicum miliaceum]|uniref:Subtilisin-like protease SBT1.7 n=1 Tax=Panicum miliaceum TaxID=4540 RepID=A0A3L6SWM7_PANMI|nr:hypothetical protein C2845_PM05G28750 [Panicum miliaceum]